MITLTQHEETFRIRSRWLWLHRFLFGLLVALLYIPYKVATNGQVYPDLSQAPIWLVLFGFVWVICLAEAWKQTIVVTLGPYQFTVKKWTQSARQFPYDSIEGYHEYSDQDRRGPYQTLVIYLPEDYFTIRSIDFEAYEQLKARLTEHKAIVPRKRVITRIERNRLRWLIGSLSVLIVANIVYGYLAHNPETKQPAQLISVTSTLDRIRPDADRGILKGFTIRLSNWPDFEFYISRKAYADDLRRLQQEITLNRSVRVLIRDSDFRKKLLKTEPLTLGDKYDNFKHIPVFGVEQVNGLRLRAAITALEPTHTKPGQRTAFLGVLLLFCWAGWVYTTQTKVLGRS